MRKNAEKCEKMRKRCGKLAPGSHVFNGLRRNPGKISTRPKFGSSFGQRTPSFKLRRLDLLGVVLGWLDRMSSFRKTRCYRLFSEKARNCRRLFRMGMSRFWPGSSFDGARSVAERTPPSPFGIYWRPDRFSIPQGSADGLASRPDPTWSARRTSVPINKPRRSLSTFQTRSRRTSP